MEKQEAIGTPVVALVDEKTLSDNSKVYDVVAFDGNSRLTVHTCDSFTAGRLALMLNHAAGFSIEHLDTKVTYDQAIAALAKHYIEMAKKMDKRKETVAEFAGLILDEERQTLVDEILTAVNKQLE